MTRGFVVALMLLAWRCAGASDVAESLDALNRLCRSTIEKGDYELAQRTCRRVTFDLKAMAPGSAAHIASVMNMGDIKARIENYVEADAWYSSALQLVERVYGTNSEQAADLLTMIVGFRVRRGKYLDAIALTRRVLSIREDAVVRARYAELLSQSRMFVEAEAEYRRAIEVLALGGARDAEVLAVAVQQLGEMYERRAQYRQAELQYRRVVEIVERYGLSYRMLAGALDRVAYVCEQQDEPGEAAAFYRRALETLRDTQALRVSRASQTVADRIQARLVALGSQPDLVSAQPAALQSAPSGAEAPTGSGHMGPP